MEFAAKKIYTRRKPAAADAADDSCSGSEDEMEYDEQVLNQVDLQGYSNVASSASVTSVRAKKAKRGGFGGLLGNLFGRGSAEPSAPSASSREERKMQKKEEKAQGTYTKKVKAKVGVNIIALKLNTLAKNAHATNSNVRTMLACSQVNCGALFNHLSKTQNSEEGKHIWTCEFCCTSNVLPPDCADDVAAQSAGDTLDFVLEAAPPKGDDDLVKEKKQDEGITIFCIDCSGSMCVSQEVTSTPALVSLLEKMGSFDKQSKEFAALLQPDDQRPGQRNGSGFRRGGGGGAPKKIYLSRLQAVQAAVAGQIDRLYKEHPSRQVAIITFNSSVTAYGEGSGALAAISGADLHNSKMIRTLASDVSVTRPIKETKNNLLKLLFSLEEKGQTALGPAMLLGVTQAAQKRGSQLILCTDGLANLGLGSIKSVAKGDSVDDVEACAAFYATVGQQAAESGVQVSVLSIAGQEAALNNLGVVASLSGGQVDQVNPMDLTAQFSSILDRPILATNAQIQLTLHGSLKFKNTALAPPPYPGTEPPSTPDHPATATVNAAATVTDVSIATVPPIAGAVLHQPAVAAPAGGDAPPPYSEQEEAKEKEMEMTDEEPAAGSGMAGVVGGANCHYCREVLPMYIAAPVDKPPCYYKCAICEEVLLCIDCEASDKHPVAHPLLKMKAKVQVAAVANEPFVIVEKKTKKPTVEGEEEKNAEVAPEEEYKSAAGVVEVVEESPLSLDMSQSRVMVEQGNVFDDTELFFEYGFNRHSQAALRAIEGRDHVPFQVAIRYVRLDGARCLHVISMDREVTQSKEEQRAELDVGIIAANAAQLCAKGVQDGDYEKARVNAFAKFDFMRQHAKSEKERAQVSNWVSVMGPMESSVHQAQSALPVRRNSNDSDDSSDESEDEALSQQQQQQQSRSESMGGGGSIGLAPSMSMKSKKPKAFTQVMQERKAMQSDSVSASFFKMKKANRSMFS